MMPHKKPEASRSEGLRLLLSDAERDQAFRMPAFTSSAVIGKARTRAPTAL